MMAAFHYPKIGTMPSRALALLLEGREITHLDFWRIANTYRLSDPVWQLRKSGWDIQDRRATVPTADPTKRSASVAFYRLPDTAISAAGQEAQDYLRDIMAWIDKASRKAGAVAAAPACTAARAHHTKGTDTPKDSTGGAA